MSIEYEQPATLEEAWRLAASLPGSRFVAGGTDAMVQIREGRSRPPALVSLGGIPSLSALEQGSPVVVGACVKVSDLEAAVRRSVPVLARAARALGSVQVRNLATVGGNLCNASPCADLAPPLLVLDARVRLASPRGTRELPLRDFFVGPKATVLSRDEVLTAVVFDRPRGRATFLRKGRVAMDIAIASAAVLVEMDGDRCVLARVAVGSLGPTPMRLSAVEAELQGRRVDRDVLARARAAAEAEVRPIGDVRAGASYRRQLAGVLVERGLRELLDGAAP